MSFFFGETDEHGDHLFAIEGEKLPIKWDSLFKAILELPEERQEKIYELLSWAINAFK